jgi:hypothetical protein
MRPRHTKVAIRKAPKIGGISLGHDEIRIDYDMFNKRGILFNMTPNQRLALLVPWLNGDPLTYAEVRRLLKRFLIGFRAAGIRLDAEDALWTVHEESTTKSLNAVRSKVARVIASAVPPLNPDRSNRQGKENITDADMPPPVRLQFGIGRTSRGLEQIVSSNEPRDLVAYAVAMLLTSGGITLGRCPAPAPYSTRRCDRLLVTSVDKGRRPVFCSATCKVRSNAEQRDKHSPKKFIRRKR